MFGADGKQIGMDAAAHPTDTANEYTASFAVTDVPNGAISFKCSATDESTPAIAGSDTVATFVDHGPTIALENPAQGSAHAIAPAILFKFSVLDAPLSASDMKAALTGVTLKVNGVDLGDVSARKVAGMPGEYQLSIDLGDPAVFNPPPTGSVPVRLVASNKRGAIRTSDFSFSVDNSGPVIQIVSPPTPNQFIGGKVTLSFTVTDAPAGVAPETVKVVLNGTSFPYSKDDKSWLHRERHRLLVYLRHQEFRREDLTDGQYSCGRRCGERVRRRVDPVLRRQCSADHRYGAPHAPGAPVRLPHQVDVFGAVRPARQIAEGSRRRRVRHPPASVDLGRGKLC